MKVLITGGAGYIGSTIASALLDCGHTPVILDSFVVGRMEFVRDRIFYEGDIADEALIQRIFSDHPDISGCIHCAALIVVPESVAKPYEYYTENVVKSMALFKALSRIGMKNIVFSSSASIYAPTDDFKVLENSPIMPLSPYARTKYMMEFVLEDFCSAYGMRGLALRFFNPIGADPQMRTGVHLKHPTHVLGKMVSVAMGEESELVITGAYWPTRDGSGIRDYFHVWDLALAHVKAVERFDSLFEHSPNTYSVINLGTGNGVTVFELLNAFQNVYGKKLNIRVAEPRPGDVAGSYAACDKAKELLGWEAKLTLEQGIADALKWAEMRESIIKY